MQPHYPPSFPPPLPSLPSLFLPPSPFYPFYLLEVVQAKLLVLHISMVSDNRSCCPGVKPQHHLPGHHRLGLPHMTGAEEELPVEVGDVDGVQVDDLHLLEARQHQVLEQLAADAPCAHHQQLGGSHGLCQCRAQDTGASIVRRRGRSGGHVWVGVCAAATGAAV